MALWTQIATRFADAEDWLMFEVMNEIQDGSWGTGKPNEYKVMNAWNQACVDAIRATGGNNATRWIGCPAYNTNLTAALNGWEKPNDPANLLHFIILQSSHFPTTFKLPNIPSIYCSYCPVFYFIIK